MSTEAARPTLSFPFKSLLWFVTGAVCLRLLTIMGWAFFPGAAAGAQLACIVIPIIFSAVLIVFNQRMLARDGFPPNALGLSPTPAHAGGFLAGFAVMPLLLIALAGALWLAVPFHYERGPLTVAGLGVQSLEYLGGNTCEEFIFRGYLLLLLRRHCGVVWAVAITGLLFGLFHLPGLSGVVALKMIGTTFLCGCLFAYGYLLTGTIWTAVGLHVAGNIALHHLLGLSGNKATMWTPVFDRPWPTTYDPAFLAWLVILSPVVTIAALVYRLLSSQAGHVSVEKAKTT